MADKELILVDFDNTLFFTDKTAILASKELLGAKLNGTMIRMLPRETKSKVYELGYSKYRDHSVPNRRLINFISKRKNARVVILTARLNDSHKHVVYLLKKNKIAVADIIYRKRSELRIPDEEWKRRKVNALAKKYQKIDLFEDKPENINHMKSGIESDAVTFFLVKGNTIRKA